MNKDWLISNASIPIQYILTNNEDLTEPFLKNDEVVCWLKKLSDRVAANDLSNIHGSHDYRYENIIGKCFILGMNKKIPQFMVVMQFFINFLNKHIKSSYDDLLTFWKMYQFRDYETILSCYLPFLGYYNEPCVRYVADKRIRITYEFTKQQRYDIYRSENKYPGAGKDWVPYIIDPALYKDGNISVPSIHDLVLFAGMYRHLNQNERDMAEASVAWIFGEGYSQINNALYYYAPDDQRYKSKGINNKVMLPDISLISGDKFDMQRLLYICFILSHFEAAKKSQWFAQALHFFEQYKNADGRYAFPREMLAEKQDAYVTNGGHMNIGESKKSRMYSEILSTYWMERICGNLT